MTLLTDTTLSNLGFLAHLKHIHLNLKKGLKQIERDKECLGIPAQTLIDRITGRDFSEIEKLLRLYRQGVIAIRVTITRYSVNVYINFYCTALSLKVQQSVGNI